MFNRDRIHPFFSALTCELTKEFLFLFDFFYLLLCLSSTCTNPQNRMMYLHSESELTEKESGERERERERNSTIEEVVEVCIHSPAGHLQEAVPSERVRQVELFRQGLWTGPQGS